MKKILLLAFFGSLFLYACNFETGPSIGAGPVELGLHVNQDGEFELEGNVSIPIIGFKEVVGGVSWDIAFSTVLNEVEGKENYLIVLWEDDGIVSKQEFPIEQPFEVNFEKDQWVRKIQKLENGSVVVFVEKQELIGFEEPTTSPSGASSTYTETFNDLPEDGEVLNRFCLDDWGTCRNVSEANANWQDIDVASIGGSYLSDGYLIERTFLFFDTSSIPQSAIIENARLYIFSGQFLNGNTTIHVASSTASIPLTTRSFQNFSNESGGSVALYTPFEWSYIDLQQNAFDWIRAGGTTKLVLVHENDIYDIQPSEQNDVIISTGEGSNPPYLEITYTVP